MVIRESTSADLGMILAIINDAAHGRWNAPLAPCRKARRQARFDWDVGRRVVAIEFYRRSGYTLVSRSDKDRLLKKYWSIPAGQIETSVVLASTQWVGARLLIASSYNQIRLT